VAKQTTKSSGTARTARKTTSNGAAKVAKVAKKPTRTVKTVKKSTVKKVPRTRVEAAPKMEKEKKVKSPLSKKELMQYRQLLLDKRAEILGDMTSMSREALSDPSNLSHMPIHMADVGSDQYDQELMLGLVESERKLVNEINDALQRIIDGTYGICQATFKPIGKPRLQAKPWAKYCIEAAREMERTGGRGF
jgi:RNA polymerase-binding protein DksA